MEKKGKWDAQNRSKRKIYERIALQDRREHCLSSRLEQAAAAAGMSKNAYIITHLEKALSEAGYPRPTGEGQSEDDVYPG